MNIEQLYRDYGIPIASHSSKHYRTGWINTSCPFCSGNAGEHLGYNIDGNYYYCWRCGGKQKEKVISTLCNISYSDAKNILKNYGGVFVKKEAPKIRFNTKKFKLPSDLTELKTPHKNYLKSRDFNYKELQKVWNLKGTGIYSKIDFTDYSKRIVIPYFWNDKIVSFDSRDITNTQNVKYKACSLEREIIPHKNILYGLQKEWDSEIGICVEGCTDVWRLGVKSFAVSGIEYTTAQVILMKKYFKKIAVIFDPDPQAILQAKKLVADLRFRGVEAYSITLKNDPGDLSSRNAKKLVNKILTNKFDTNVRNIFHTN